MTRTTVSLHESTLRKVRELSRREHHTLGQTVSEILDLGLQRKDQLRQPRRPFKLPTFHMGAPRVPLEDKEAIAALLERKVP
jgi:hypothetical protein